MKITMENSIFTATLEDNSSVEALKEMLMEFTRLGRINDSSNR